jgi:glycerol-3-phosphate dehydrogenase (NAD(P)+)
MTDTDRAPILVLGDGGWGTALAMVLRGSEHEDVRVWGYDEEYSREIETTRQNPRFLADVEIPAGIRFGTDAADLADGVEVVISVIPTQFLCGALQNIRDSLPAKGIYVSCSKGFERQTLELPSRRIRECLPESRIAVLSGPSHAEEVSRGLPTTVVVGSEDLEVARRVQELFTVPYFRIYTSTDPLGVEIAGASKNVIALAAGISDGLGYGDNARAALVCRGASEITRLGVALGAREETFGGLSGIGDLVATCTSLHSRNHAVGARIGEGESLEAILASTQKVAEGVETTRSLHEIAVKINVELPITSEVYAVLFDGKSPRKAVEDLMTRDQRQE